MNEIDKLQPPQSQAAEQAVLGACLKDPQALEITLARLRTEDDFCCPHHKLIYLAILDLSNSAQVIDLVTVARHLGDSGDLEKARGRVYLAELSENVVSSANIQSHIDIVVEKSRLRQTIVLFSEFSRAFYQNMDFEQGRNAVISALNTIGGAPATSKTMLDAMNDLVIDLETPADRRRLVPTPFGDLNDKIEGFYPGEYVVVGGRSSSGKTSFAIQCGWHLAERGGNVFYYALDHKAADMARRVVTAKTAIPRRDMHAGAARKVRDEHTATLGRFFYAVPSGSTVAEFKAACRREVRQHDCRLIILDHLGQTETSGRSRYELITNASHEIKRVGIELDVPILVLSQLRRLDLGGMNIAKDRFPRPTLEDLRDSGAIEQDANAVILLHNSLKMIEAKEGTNSDVYKTYVEKFVTNDRVPVEFIVAKQKDGDTGTVDYYFNRKTMTYVAGLETHREEPRRLYD